MFVGLMDKLGIADAINKNAVLCKGGYDVAAALADGRADLGTTFISEALPVKGVKVVGALPGNLHYTNTYTAAIHAKAASPDAPGPSWISSPTRPSATAGRRLDWNRRSNILPALRHRMTLPS